MSKEILSAIIGGITGSVISAIFYYIMEKRKEIKEKEKTRQEINDTIGFIRSLKQFSGLQKEYEKYLNNLGTYRAKKIGPILEKINLCNFQFGMRGGLTISLLNGFNDYTKDELRNIINDIKNNKYIDSERNI